ncbi:MAG: diguanylate cyclase [Leptospirillia bacterium]
MNLLAPIRRSIKIRFALASLAIALPLVALSVLSFGFFDRFSETGDQLVARATDEMLPISRLQTLVLLSAQPPHEYLIQGDARQIGKFAPLADEVERIFDQRAEVWVDEPLLTSLLENARAEWDKSRVRAGQLLAMQPPLAQGAVPFMADYDRHRERTVAALDRLYTVIESAGHAGWAAARQEVERRLVVVIGVIWMLLAVAFGGAVFLIRSILGPLRRMQRMTERLAEGDLSQRVEIDREDELGRLVHAFNRMVHELEKSQAKLKYLSVHDELTGLLNRRALLQYLNDELERSERFRKPCTLLMVDIDYFKQINDNHGHMVGDRVLRMVAETLAATVRAVDRVARYGGEEFLIILPETNISGARALADRIREAVAERGIDLAEKLPSQLSVHMTVSVGVAAYPADGKTLSALISAVDEAMYRAIRGGRNRVCVYREAA